MASTSLIAEIEEIELIFPTFLLELLSTFQALLPMEASVQMAIGFCLLSMMVSCCSIFSGHSRMLKIKMNMPFVPSPLPFFGSVKDFLLTVPWDLITGEW